MKAGDLVRTRAYSKKYNYGVIVSVLAPVSICVLMYGGIYKGKHIYLRGYDFDCTEILG
tara:strand:+ start:1136 stop:1312 length:177 start_codon:yes stop_codon:yes gene_type:complete